MKLNEQILNMIRRKLGVSLSRPAEFEALIEDIYRTTGERLGVNTLKRLFGTINGVTPTRTTLNIIAQYLGYDTFTLLEASINGTNSNFSNVTDALFPQDLDADAIIVVEYEPNRQLDLKVMHDKRLQVIKSVGTKLHGGDILLVPSIMLHAPFIAKSVERNGNLLSTYTGGIEGGVTALRVMQEADG